MASAIVKMVFDAIRDERIELAFEPVCSAQDLSQVLYRECLVRIRDMNGMIVYPMTCLPRMERLGLIKHADCYVVRRAIELLRRTPQLSLGVNVSAQSAEDIAWWKEILRELSVSPGVAGRLIVELTETEKITLRHKRTLFASLKDAGCRIAIDDFGAGHSIHNADVIGEPDLIKIDRSVIQQARDSEASRFLQKVLDAARRRCPSMIVEGIEFENDLSLVGQMENCWLQGHWLNDHSVELNIQGPDGIFIH